MRITLVTPLLFSLALIGCSDSSNSSTGNEVTGTIRGKVVLFDKWGHKKDDWSGVEVKGEGTNFSTVTDSAGNWELHGIPAKTVSLSFSKNGYSSYKNPTYTVIANSIVKYMYDVPLVLTEIPTWTFVLDYVDSSSRYIYGHAPAGVPSGLRLQAKIIIGATPILTIDDPSSYISYEYLNNLDTTHQDKAYNFDNDFTPTLLKKKLTPGQRIYFRGYPAVFRNLRYDDLSLKFNYYTGLGAGSNVLSIILK